MTDTTVNPDVCDLLCLDLPKAEAVAAGCPQSASWRAWPARRRRWATRPVWRSRSLRDAQTACVCDLAWIVGRDERLVSHHARQLKTAGLARSERNGKMVMYELTDRCRALLDALAGVPSTA